MLFQQSQTAPSLALSQYLLHTIIISVTWKYCAATVRIFAQLAKRSQSTHERPPYGEPQTLVCWIIYFLFRNTSTKPRTRYTAIYASITVKLWSLRKDGYAWSSDFLIFKRIVCSKQILYIQHIYYYTTMCASWPLRARGIDSPSTQHWICAPFIHGYMWEAYQGFDITFMCHFSVLSIG